MRKLSRRNALKTGAMLAAGTAAGVGADGRYAQAADRAGSKYNWGHTIDFGAQYHLRVREMLENIRSNEMGLIDDIAERMVETLKRGGNVWLQNSVGHMPPHEFNPENKGNPGIMKSGEMDYEQVKKGDVLVTNSVDENVRSARDKGVYVPRFPR